MANERKERVGGDEAPGGRSGGGEGAREGGSDGGGAARAAGGDVGGGEQEVSRLFGEVSSGDRAAVEVLLARYHQDLHAYLDRHAGRELQGRETPADLAQSVCREVLEGLQRGAFEFRGEAQFRQWLYRAALHKVRMKARYFGAERRGRQREQRLDDLTDSRGQPAVADSHTPSRSAVGHEEQRRFVAALAQLSDAQRQVVEWAHFEGLSHKDIAARLGITEGSSRMMLSRALAQLARIATRGG